MKPSPENPFGLRAKEQLFVEAYCGLAELNALKAYGLAGYTPEAANAARLLKKPRIAAAIAAKQAPKLQKLAMDGDEALERISVFGRADIRKFFPADHRIAQLPDEIAMCVKAVTPTRYGDRIELIDPLRACELLAKSAGRLKETVKVQHTLEEVMTLANQRIRDKEAAHDA